MNARLHEKEKKVTQKPTILNGYKYNDILKKSLLLLILAFLTPTTLSLYSCAFFGENNEKAGLSVSGAKIVSSGIPIQLKGVVMPAYTELKTRSIESDLDVLLNWGGNAVRVIIDPCDWRDRKDETSSLLKRTIKAALERGLYPIIDWHQIGWPDGWSADIGRYDTNFNLTKEFWAYMASTYNDNRILFELWNEPAYSENDPY